MFGLVKGNSGSGGNETEGIVLLFDGDDDIRSEDDDLVPGECAGFSHGGSEKRGGRRRRRRRRRRKRHVVGPLVVRLFFLRLSNSLVTLFLSYQPLK